MNIGMRIAENNSNQRAHHGKNAKEAKLSEPTRSGKNLGVLTFWLFWDRHEVLRLNPESHEWT